MIRNNRNIFLIIFRSDEELPSSRQGRNVIHRTSTPLKTETQNKKSFHKKESNVSRIKTITATSVSTKGLTTPSVEMKPPINPQKKKRSSKSHEKAESPEIGGKGWRKSKMISSSGHELSVWTRVSDADDGQNESDCKDEVT